jgi:hypothetical protein
MKFPKTIRERFPAADLPVRYLADVTVIEPLGAP